MAPRKTAESNNSEHQLTYPPFLFFFPLKCNLYLNMKPNSMFKQIVNHSAIKEKMRDFEQTIQHLRHDGCLILFFAYLVLPRRDRSVQTSEFIGALLEDADCTVS